MLPQVTTICFDAGLPNITGSLSTYENIMINDTPNSALYVAGQNGVFSYHDFWPKAVARLNFDASICNQIYGASVTVQPPSVTVNCFIKAR